MTPTQPRLIRQALNVVATLMVVAGVIAMHSLMLGHGHIAQAGPPAAMIPPHVMPQYVMPKYVMPQDAMVIPADTTKSHPSAVQRVATQPVLAGLGSRMVHDMLLMCLAVLPALALLLALALLRRRMATPTLPGGGLLRHTVAIRGSPPRRLTPSLSQLCVLRA